MDASAHFRGKRITVMGLGLLGRGVGDARYLAECGADLIVTDLKTREQLVESVAQLEQFKNIQFVLGEHRLEDFRNRDLILKAAGKKVLLGGNIRGVSNLELLKEVTPEHTAVLELDSWQLQGLGEAKMSPHIAVFTTLYADHLNYYKSDLDAYLGDKANIFLNQNEEDTLILSAQCAPTIIDRYGEKIKSKTLVIDTLTLPDTWVLHIPGIH